MNKRWDILILCIIFTGIGAWGGWTASRQTDRAAGPPEEDKPAAPESPTLTEQTLRNLGVTTGVAEPTTFTTYRAVPAVIEETAFTERPVFAPIGGRVLEVHAEPGKVVAAGQTLLTLVRDPIPRPMLALTADIIKPAREEIHRSVAELRKTRDDISIIETEMKRVDEFTGKVGGEDLPILPMQTIIELRYQLTRARRAHEQSRLELTKHGFSEQQIAEIAAGNHISNLGKENWKRALIENGLWTDAAQSLFDALPKDLQEDRWTIATVGELAAAGLVKPGLIDWVKELGGETHFLEIGALLQQGYSVQDLRRLHDFNALDPIVHLEAPGDGNVPDWDVRSLDVKPGSHVETGDRLLSLLNPREMYLRVDPVGAEKTDVLRAVERQAVCEAVPLEVKAGPRLKDVTLDFVRSEAETRGTTAFARVANEPLATKEARDGVAYRSWKLRSGLRYMLRVPTRVLEKVFVLPSAAVVDDGPSKVVFIPDGETFRAVEVEIAYQDEEVAVIAINRNTRLFPGDSVVTGGAYSLGLALRSGTGAVDPHAGHSH